MAVARKDRELGVVDASAIELTAPVPEASTCWPCLTIALVPGVLMFLAFVVFDMVGEEGWLRIPVILILGVYMTLMWAMHKGEVGDAPDTRVFLSDRAIWHKPYREERFQCVDLRYVLSAATQQADGRAFVQFVRVEWALSPDSTHNRIEFVPDARYRFDAEGENPVCAMIRERVASVRAAADAQAQAHAASSAAKAGVLLDLRETAVDPRTRTH